MMHRISAIHFENDHGYNAKKPARDIQYRPFFTLRYCFEQNLS